MRSNIILTPPRAWSITQSIAVLAILLCVLVMIPLASAENTNVTLIITDDRTRYLATITGYEIERYAITEPGFLGETVAVEVANVTIASLDDPILTVTYTEKRGEYQFPPGNYSISYDAPVLANGISLSFIDPVDITAIFPPGADLSNRMLATIQPMPSSLEIMPNNSTTAIWSNVRSMSVRFSDEHQVHLLWLFAQFLVIVAVIMLWPFFLAPKEEKMKIPPKKPIQRRR